MLLFLDGPVKVSTESACEPCTFKALWFSDSAILSPNNNDRDFLLEVLRSLYTTSSWLRQYLTRTFTAKLYSLLSIYMYLAILADITLCIWTDPKAKYSPLQENPSSGELTFDEQSHTRLSTFNRLPAEIRLNILEYLIGEDTIVKAVGYNNGARNIFLVKEKGYCPLPVMLTCKQLYLDMQDVYFRSMSVTFKAAFPSAFDGNMASFASAYFKANVGNVRISDPDLRRRRKIAAAFQRAQIEFQNKGASGSRKGAYYFN